jgi:hypothetical protein
MPRPSTYYTPFEEKFFLLMEQEKPFERSWLTAAHQVAQLVGLSCFKPALDIGLWVCGLVGL